MDHSTWKKNKPRKIKIAMTIWPLGSKVLRFASREVLKEREAVAEIIYRTIKPKFPHKKGI